MLSSRLPECRRNSPAPVTQHQWRRHVISRWGLPYYYSLALEQTVSLPLLPYSEARVLVLALSGGYKVRLSVGARGAENVSNFQLNASKRFCQKWHTAVFNDTKLSTFYYIKKCIWSSDISRAATISLWLDRKWMSIFSDRLGNLSRTDSEVWGSQTREFVAESLLTITCDEYLGGLGLLVRQNIWSVHTGLWNIDFWRFTKNTKSGE